MKTKEQRGKREGQYWAVKVSAGICRLLQGFWAAPEIFPHFYLTSSHWSPWINRMEACILFRSSMASKGCLILTQILSRANNSNSEVQKIVSFHAHVSKNIRRLRDFLQLTLNWFKTSEAWTSGLSPCFLIFSYQHILLTRLIIKKF